MSYTPTTWHGGDVLSAEAMNKIENGIANAGSGALEVTAVYDSNTDSYTLDKTWQEIYNAFPNVYIMFSNGNYNKGIVTTVYAGPGTYVVVDLEESYYTDSASDYPTTYQDTPK